MPSKVSGGASLYRRHGCVTRPGTCGTDRGTGGEHGMERTLPGAIFHTAFRAPEKPPHLTGTVATRLPGRSAGRLGSHSSPAAWTPPPLRVLCAGPRETRVVQGPHLLVAPAAAPPAHGQPGEGCHANRGPRAEGHALEGPDWPPQMPARGEDDGAGRHPGPVCPR